MTAILRNILLISAISTLIPNLACNSGGDSSVSVNNTPVSITTQPKGTTATEFDAVTLTVSTTGDGVIAYQWFKDGTLISGAQGASLTISSISMQDAGSYTVQVANYVNTVMSDPAVVAVNAYVGVPIITTQPVSIATTVGSKATFTVSAKGGYGSSPLHYTWTKDGQDLANSDSNTYAIASVQSTDVGTYAVRITNDQGTSTSQNATLSLKAATDGTFTSTGNLHTPRYGHTATLLSSGKVLIAGGNSNSGALNSAELYDPAAGTFTLLSAPMRSNRKDHSATVLADGTVLLAGGRDLNNVPLNTTEIYNPNTNLFVDGPILSAARYGHVALRRADGSILIAGGFGTLDQALASTELLYATTTPTVGTLALARANFTATLLASGDVLAAGGLGNLSSVLASAELGGPATTPKLPGFGLLSTALNTARQEHTDTLLLDGTVLLAGGRSSSGNQLSSAEVYDPTKKAFAFTKGTMAQARRWHTATRLGDGTVLLVGGDGDLSTGVLNTAEIFDPYKSTFHTLSSTMSSPRYGHTATLLKDGSVLVVGGYSGGSLDSADLYR